METAKMMVRTNIGEDPSLKQRPGDRLNAGNPRLSSGGLRKRLLRRIITVNFAFAIIKKAQIPGACRSFQTKRAALRPPFALP